MTRPPPRTTLFPYTTLFRSDPNSDFNRAVGISNYHALQLGLNKRLSHGLQDRKSTRLNSSHMSISYAVFCLKKKTIYKRKDERNDHSSTTSMSSRSVLIV